MLVDFVDGPEEGAFRAEVRAWMEQALAELGGPEPVDLHERHDYWRRWQRAVHDAGYAGLSWPEEYGGRGASAKQQAVWAEELNRAGAPEPLNGVGEKLAGPTIIEFGTPEQKKRFLPPMLKGDAVWCQLFSEPGAGSDLASLQTRARRAEGGWRITGQKVWTSRAQIADYAIMLARTGDEPRHRGITYFIFPLRQEGVEIVPLKQMTADSEFNEVFIEDVFVPDELVLGEVDQGWTVARATLQYERAFVAMGRVDFGRWFEELVSDVCDAVQPDGSPAGADPELRQRVAHAYERALVQRVTSQRVLARVDRGEPAGPESSVGKLTISSLMAELSDLAVDIWGLDGLADPERESSARGAMWQKRAQFSRGMAIAGGTPQIQKNIVAERVLGLPRS